LIRYDPNTHKYVGQLAQGITSNSDFTQWTLTLRPNATFSDGTPVNAQAVILNYNRMMGPKATSPGSGMLNLWVQSMSSPDDHTVVFTLKRPLSSFPLILTSYPTYIAAPSFLNKLDAGDMSATAIGAGPFKFGTYTPNEQITLVRNDSYWGGKPYLDSIKEVVVPAGTGALQTFQTGGIQMGGVIDAPTKKQVADAHIPHLSPLEDIWNTLLINQRPQSQPGGSVLSDVRLREAIAYAFNPTYYNQRVNQGTGSTTSQLFPQGSRWYDASAKPLPYTPTKAKQLVAEVKQQPGWDGTINFLCSSDPTEAAIPTALQGMLQPVGFKVNVSNSMDLGSFITAVIVHPNYDLACWGVAVPDFDPVPNLYTYFATGGYTNFGKYSNTQMDAVLNDLTTAGTPAKVMSELKTFNSVWNTTIPQINIGSGGQMTFWTTKLHDVTQGININLAKAWLS
jgi:peptide/nickel transport system substrate-binding protein